MSRTDRMTVSRPFILATALLNLIAASTVALFTREAANNTLVFAGFVSVAAIVLCAWLLSRKAEVRASRREIAASSILGGVFILQLSVRQLFAIVRRHVPGPHAGLATALFAVQIAALLCGLTLMLSLLIAHCCSPASARAPKPRRTRFLLAVIAMESLLFLVSAFPSIWLRDDTSAVFSGALSDWHTIGYSIFVRVCKLVWDSHFTVLMVQTALWILLNAYILDFLNGLDDRAPTVYTLLSTASVTPYFFLECMFKDTVYTLGILSLTVALLSILHSRRMTRRDVLCLCTLPMFAVLCRHGGVIVVMLSCLAVVAVLAALRERVLVKRLIAVCALYLAVFIMISIVFTSVFHVTRNPKYVKYGTPMNMIGGAVAAGVEFDEHDRETLEKLMPVKYWGEFYNRYWADDISRYWGKLDRGVDKLEMLIWTENYGMDLLKLNAKLLIRHPAVYLKNFLDLNTMVWEITTPPDGYVMLINRSEEDPRIRYSAAYQATFPVTEFLFTHPVTAPFVVRGGIPLFILLLTAVVFILRRRKIYLVCLLPAVLNDGILFLSIPSQDPRYIIPVLVVATLFLSIVLCRCPLNGVKPAEKGDGVSA